MPEPKAKVTQQLLVAIEDTAAPLLDGQWRAADFGAHGWAVVSCANYAVAGNSSEEAARYIARVDPDTVMSLVAHIRELEGERDRLNMGYTFQKEALDNLAELHTETVGGLKARVDQLENAIDAWPGNQPDSMLAVAERAGKTVLADWLHQLMAARRG